MMIGSTIYPLDEFRPFMTDDGRAMSVVVYGEAEIEYAADGDDWRVASIAIDVEVASAQDAAWQAWGQPREFINETHPLWAPICKALQAREADYIEDKIRSALEMQHGIVFAGHGD